MNYFMRKNFYLRKTCFCTVLLISIILFYISLTFISCKQESIVKAGGGDGNIPTTFQWTWISGSEIIDSKGSYRVQNISDVNNFPGGRNSSAFWTDTEGNFWLFGGYGLDYSGGSPGSLNDMWKYDGSNWIWVLGEKSKDVKTSYSPSTIDILGGRSASSYCSDNKGNFWLFGGIGLGPNGSSGFFNDLWSFDGKKWTFVSGEKNTDINGNYGIKAQAQASNNPGSRSYASSWFDKVGNFWLFGGSGFDSIGNQGNLNDLWKFDGSQWTWISGGNKANNFDPSTNTPSPRSFASTWTDKDGNLYLFGGSGFDANGFLGNFNDLWKFDGSQWNFISGDKKINVTPNYGNLGISSTSNILGARNSATSWIDIDGNFWIFGGFGIDYTGNSGNLNDLWKFSKDLWSWVSGEKFQGAKGSYLKKGFEAAGNIPGSRQLAASWTDSKGNIWLFGGLGKDSAGNSGNLNDLWKFTIK